jgi:hypothetical protein
LNIDKPTRQQLKQHRSALLDVYSRAAIFKYVTGTFTPALGESKCFTACFAYFFDFKLKR